MIITTTHQHSAVATSSTIITSTLPFLMPSFTFTKQQTNFRNDGEHRNACDGFLTVTRVQLTLSTSSLAPAASSPAHCSALLLTVCIWISLCSSVTPALAPACDGGPM